MFNKAVDYLMESRNLALHMRKIDLESLNIRELADASFAINHDHTSQLELTFLLCDKEGNAYVLHFASYKSRRVARSVLGAERSTSLMHTTSCIAPREIWHVY